MKKNLKRYLAAVLAASMVMSSTGISSLGSSINLGSDDQSAPTSEITSGGADKDLTGPDSSESKDQGSTDNGKDAGTSGKEDSDASIFDSENNAPADGSGETGGEEGSGDDGTEGGNESGGSENGGTGNTDNNNGGEDGTGSDSGLGSSGNGQPGNGGTEPDGEDGTGAGAGAGDNESTTPSGSEGDDSVTGGTTPGNPAEKPAGDGGHTGGGSSTPENNAGNNNTTPDKPADVTSGEENAAEGTDSATGGTTPEKPQPETEKKPEAEIEETPEDEPEDELQSYILESITFPGEELISYTENADTSEAGTEDEKEEKSGFLSLFSLFSADETVEESEETEETENPQTIRYIERHVEVGDDVKDIKLPNKMVLSLVPVDDESEEVDIATNSDASGNNGNGLKEKFASVKKSKSEIKTLRVDLDEDDWIIISPDELSGEGLDAFDTSGVEILDEDDNPTGEYSTEHAVYPQYILVPDLENLSLEDEDGSPIDTDDLLAGPASADIQTYLLNNASARVSVGTRANGELLEDGTAEIALNLADNTAEGEYYSFDSSTGTLTLKAGSPAAKSFKLYVDTDGVQDLEIHVSRIVFDSSLSDAETVPLTFDGTSTAGGISITNAQNSGTAAIDLTNIKSLDLNIKGNVSLTGANNAAAISVGKEQTLSISGGGSLNVKAGARSSVGIGVTDGECGTVNFNGGNITIDGNGYVGVGKLENTPGTGRVNVNGGSVEILGGTIDAEYPIQGVTLKVAPYGICDFTAHSANTNNNSLVLEGGPLLRGYIANIESSGKDVELSITKDGEDKSVKTITVPQDERGFMTNLPEAGTYLISGTYEGKECGYVGELDGTQTGEFVVSDDNVNIYTNIKHTFLPVFWDSEVVISGTMTAEGELDVTFSAAIDIREDRSLIAGTADSYNAGDEDKQQYGFYIYQKDEKGDVKQGSERYVYVNEADVDEEPAGDASSGAYYSYTIKGDSENPLVPGETYYFIPYTVTNAGMRYADEVYYGGLNEEGEYDPTIEVVLDKTPEIEFTMPKIEFPSKVEFTYETTTEEALGRQEFHNIAGAVYGDDNTTVTIDGVKLTFDTSKEEENAIWGTNIPQSTFRLNKTGDQDNGWSDVMIPVPESGASVDYTYPADGSNFVIEFVAPEPSAEHGSVIYKNIAQPVAVKVNPKEIQIAGIGESATKIYDGNNSVIWRDDETITFRDGDVIIPYIYSETGVAQQGELDEVYVDMNGLTAVYDDEKAGTDKTITINNPVLTGEDAGNYIFPAGYASEGAVLTGIGAIQAKDITIKPVEYTKKTGESWIPDGGYQIEIVGGAETGVVPENIV